MTELIPQLESLGFKVVITDKTEDLIGWTEVVEDTVFIDTISQYTKQSTEFNPILTCVSKSGKVVEFLLSSDDNFGFYWIEPRNARFFVEDGFADTRILPLIKLFFKQ